MENKVALITGAGQGIGRAIALELAGAGCRVVVADINYETAAAVAAEVQEKGGQAVATGGDVSNREQVRDMFAASSSFGPVEILVNNAGVFPFVGFGELSEEQWDLTMNVNIKGPYFCIQEALHCMPDGGRIINISSIAGQVGIPTLAHYCASKAAVDGLVRGLAVELADRRITVNAVAPGAIHTPGADGASDEEGTRQLLSNVPYGEKGDPADIAAMVCFLASSQAQYITGQVIAVDGGWTAK